MRSQSGTSRSLGCAATTISASLVLYLTACGENEDSPPQQAERLLGAQTELAAALANTAPPLMLEQTTWFHRIDLVRDAGRLVSLARVDTVELERLPVPALSLSTCW